MYKGQARLVKRFLILLDVYLIVVAFTVAVRLQRLEPIITVGHWLDGQAFRPYLPFKPYLPYILLAAVIWVGSLYYSGSYSPLRKTAYPALAWSLFKSVAIASLSLAVISLILKDKVLSRIFILLTFSCTLIFLIIERFILLHFLHSIRRKGYNSRKFLIVGSGSRARRFVRCLEAQREWGLRVIGFIDEASLVGREIEGKRVIACFDDLEKVLDNNVVDEVVFIMPRKWIDQAEKYIMICERVGVKATVALDLFNTNIAKARTSRFENIPLLCMETIPSQGWKLCIKRCMDILIAGIALIILSPLFLGIAVLVKLTSPGPVILKQERTGQNGRKFTMYKFRTMVVGAEKMLDEVKGLNEGRGPVFHSRFDPRVTKAGRFIRKFSLDELPQLWNVFRGNMSIVGPRPPLPDEVEAYERWQRRRLSLKPGLVCLWQVTKRYQADFEEWVKTDLGYIDNWSLGLDLKILLKVLPAIWKGARHWSG